MSKYKYQKEFLFSTKKLEEIELFLDNEEVPLDIMVIRDAKKSTVIHHCSYLNQPRLLEFYIKYFRRNLENKGFGVSQMKSRTKMLLDETNNQGYSAAHYAAFKGNITVLKILQRYEADLQRSSDLGMNLLHLAAQGDKINTVLFLHDKQFNVNTKDSKNSTPLHWAAYSGSEKIVEYLLVHPEILINEIDKDGHTPLHIASAYGNSKIVKKLLLAGADRKITDLKGQTALNIAKQNQFQKISKMLDDKYSFVDYLKFACNAKLKYKPHKRSYLQPFLYLFLFAVMNFLSFGIIKIDIQQIFVAQIFVFSVELLLFISLIFEPARPSKQHSYEFYSQKEQINRLCMECIRPMRPRDYHCMICHVCVHQYDHHCPWINNCIGKNNLFRFNLFIIFTQISLIWLGYISIVVFQEILLGKHQSTLFTINDWVMTNNLEWIVYFECFVVFFIDLVIIFPLFCLILVQMKNMLLGKTTYERFTKTNESILTRDGSELLNKSWQNQTPSISLRNCVSMCLDEEIEDKLQNSNSTTSSFVREH